MGKECGAWVSRRLWGGGNTSPLKTTAREATAFQAHRHFVTTCVSPLGSQFSDNLCLELLRITKQTNNC